MIRDKIDAIAHTKHNLIRRAKQNNNTISIEFTHHPFYIITAILQNLQNTKLFFIILM